jgi:hypothetical protein
VEALIAEMTGKGLQPPISTYNALLTLYSKLHLSAKAVILLEDLKNLPIEPNLTTQLLVKAFGQQGQHCVRGSGEPMSGDVGAMYNDLIPVYCELKQPERAADLALEIKKGGGTLSTRARSAMRALGMHVPEPW